MICELRIVKTSGVVTSKCETFEETLFLMVKEFAIANACEVEEAGKMLAPVSGILENLSTDSEFTAWEIEDHDKNNEITSCIIRKIAD